MKWTWLLLVPFALASDHETYDESLSLKTLRDGKVLATFEFVTTVPGRNNALTFGKAAVEQPRHLRLFPLALAQLLERYAVQELHLSLNAGKWNYPVWGNPDVSSVPGGAELWAWISSSGDETARQRWRGLTNGLSGLFCASLGALDDKRTVTPRVSFRHEGFLPLNSSYELLYAPYPSETVCTENLTPFIKMLPCKSQSGIAMLLNPYRLFDADWHGIGVHVTSNELGIVTLRLTVSAVLDPVRLSPSGVRREWSLKTLFDRTISRTCLVASTSLVKVQLPQEAYSLEPSPSITENDTAVFGLNDVRGIFDIALGFQAGKMEYAPLANALPLSIRRMLRGGQTTAELSVRIENDASESQSLLWFETMPWFMNLYLHTLQVKVDGEDRNDLLDILTYIAPSDHKPTLFEAKIHVPAASTLIISMAVEKSFILYTEHPPDASRGWDLPAAAFTLLGSPTLQRMYSTTLLGDLPTPDFSMPYNVIIMTSTLIALFFGSVFNLVTRSFVWNRVHDDRAKIE